MNLVRFFWRREINKKTKIMRKVKFPFDLDVLDLVTPSLKARLVPVNEKLKGIDKDRAERAKVRRRARVVAQEQATEAMGKEADRKAGVEHDPALTAQAMEAAAVAGTAAGSSSDAMVVDAPAGVGAGEGKKPVAVLEGELVDEPSKRLEEAQLLRSLVDPGLAGDAGANCTGMYELSAIVTHKGASADGGELSSSCSSLSFPFSVLGALIAPLCCAGG